MGVEKYAGLTRKSGGRAVWNGMVREDHGALEIPYRWRKPRKIFVNSMSDLFHERVSDSFILDVWKVMRVLAMLRWLGNATSRWGTIQTYVLNGGQCGFFCGTVPQWLLIGTECRSIMIATGCNTVRVAQFPVTENGCDRLEKWLSKKAKK